MIKIFQKRWFDIEFSQISQISSKQLASDHFYKHFYEVFYKKFPDYESLPSEYIASKREVAFHLGKIISGRQAKNILSYGCGNGFIEKELVSFNPSIQLFAYETIESNLRWLKDISNINTCFGEFPDCLPNKQEFDLVYLNCMDYTLSNEEYIGLLSTIKKLTSSPILFTQVIKPYPSLLSFVKYWTKRVMSLLQLYDLGQLWGYLRYFHEHKKIFKQAGYKIIKKEDISRELFWMEISPVHQ